MLLVMYNRPQTVNLVTAGRLIEQVFGGNANIFVQKNMSMHIICSIIIIYHSLAASNFSVAVGAGTHGEAE